MSVGPFRRSQPSACGGAARRAPGPERALSGLRTRLHESLGDVPPAEFEDLYARAVRPDLSLSNRRGNHCTRSPRNPARLSPDRPLEAPWCAVTARRTSCQGGSGAGLAGKPRAVRLRDAVGDCKTIMRQGDDGPGEISSGLFKLVEHEGAVVLLLLGELSTGDHRLLDPNLGVVTDVTPVNLARPVRQADQRRCDGTGEPQRFVVLIAAVRPGVHRRRCEHDESRRELSRRREQFDWA
jgi:hypothetical protein